MMSFTAEQVAALKAPLDRGHVKSRSQSGRNLSYIEGWHAIAEANAIFGFDAWTSETVDLRLVSERERAIGKDKKPGWGVSYIARVRVVVFAGEQIVTREGVGAGHGIDTDLGLAHESAVKEAETDARKRALMTFGNRFGLALYDKEQRNVADSRQEAPPEPHPADIYIRDAMRIIDLIESEDEGRAWWKDEAERRRAAQLNQDDVNRLKAALTARVKALAPAPAEAA